MKKYERPVVMINEELAEGVYAASGASVVSAEGCWVLDYVSPVHQENTIYTNNGVQVQISITHTNPENHLSSAKVTINFNQTITSILEDSAVTLATFEGSTVYVTTDLTTYNAGPENKTYNITVQCDSPSTLSVTGKSIECLGI